ncbi:Hypothetical predicted protein [Pelobates cultripes]|uniref:Uncharacterized protein n=1 Tax=Pelobates cultripes TaxID=61616 RepID=A0AAD1S0G8_PELCU|nr:Hypothetical predicted protein [Pelobates cultripes]
MAVPPDSPYSSSKDEVLDAPDDIPRTEGLDSSPQMEDLAALATKGDIKALMHNISAFFNADLDIIREDMTVVTARVTVTEESISSLTQYQESNTEQICQLQAAHKAVQVQIASLEDTR